MKTKKEEIEILSLEDVNIYYKQKIKKIRLFFWIPFLIGLIPLLVLSIFFTIRIVIPTPNYFSNMKTVDLTIDDITFGTVQIPNDWELKKEKIYNKDWDYIYNSSNQIVGLQIISGYKNLEDAWVKSTLNPKIEEYNYSKLYKTYVTSFSNSALYMVGNYYEIAFEKGIYVESTKKSYSYSLLIVGDVSKDLASKITYSYNWKGMVK